MNANKARSLAAAGRTVEQARAALGLPGMPAAQWRALKLRVMYPSMSLAELGKLAGWTRHRFAGQLRRGLAYAADRAADEQT